MSTPGVDRRLAAILSADVVGYSRLMAEDEEATARTLAAYRDEIALLVRQHRGRVVDSPGDNLLAEFPTATDAVACSVEIQRVVGARNASLPTERTMEFRIGVHVGEVAFEADRIYGGGVNIAARLQALADPRGICVSGAVHEQVGKKLAVAYLDLGLQSLKNIPEPVRAYRVRTDELARRPAVAPRRGRWGVVVAATLVAAAAILAGWRLLVPDEGGAPESPISSLAVLPLENLSGDPEQEYFADGMTEALITDLGKIGSLRVSARPSVMKYKETTSSPREIARELGVQALVSGSVMRSGDRVRIAAQLIDPEAGRHSWSESYERDLRDVLALQREVAGAIAAAVRAKLRPDPGGRTRNSRPVDPEAYESLLRARYLATRTAEADSQEAIALLERAVALDPDFAPSHAELAAAYASRLLYVAPEEARALELKAFAAVERALALDPELAEAYQARGNMLWSHSFRFAHGRAVQEYLRALRINPNLDRAHEGLARVFVHVGFFEEALEHAARALEINPSNLLALIARSEAELFAGSDEAALATLSSIPSSVVPELVAAHTVWTLVRLGRPDEAASRLRQASRTYPDDQSGVLSGVHALLLADSDPDKALELVRQVEARRAFGQSHHAAYFAGAALARMNRAEEAVQWLREAAESGLPCYPLFANDPNLDPIRQDPKFLALLADVRHGFESLRRALLFG